MRTLCMLVVLGSATAAAGQTTPAAPAWDVSANTGVLVSHPAGPPDSALWEHWYQGWTLGISAGRYVSPHLKLEGEVFFSSEGSRYGERVVDVPNLGPFAVTTEQLTRNTGVTGEVVWQFLDNAWVHPFVLAGVTCDFERRRFHTWPQPIFLGNPPFSPHQVVNVPESFDDLGTDLFVRGVFGGGAKMYVSPRAFFRADSHIAVGSGPTGHVTFRLGFGLDF